MSEFDESLIRVVIEQAMLNGCEVESVSVSSYLR
jgi:hypothetical protein